MDLAGTLARELGAGKVLGPEAGERLDDYGRDECDEARYRRRPDCVVFAEERADVEAVVRICRERKVPITPRGAGSGKAGGCVPLAGGVVLSTERMRRLVEVDGDDLVAVAEPGVITGELQESVEAAGMFYPPDPASLAFSTIGGNVVTNAGGPRAFKYGVTREYVLGLEVVLMSGEVLRIGRRTAKGVTGYDLVAGFVGSEGTLGVVTEVVLKLVPRPAAVRTALAVYPDVDLAGAAISALLHQGFRPRTLELMDRTCIEATRGKTEYRFPEGAGAAVLFELDGEEDGLEAALERAGGVADAAGAREVLVARDERDRRNLWQARRELSLLLRAGNRCKVGEDICVPRGALGAMIRRVDAIGAATGIRCATFGHAGDGNLHVQFLLDGEAADPAVRARVDEGLELLFRATVELGGTLSGEHGIGVTKARYLPLEQSPAVIEWQRRIKQLWDPDGLLNPGKLFPPRRAAGCSE